MLLPSNPLLFHLQRRRSSQHQRTDRIVSGSACNYVAASSAVMDATCVLGEQAGNPLNSFRASQPLGYQSIKMEAPQAWSAQQMEQAFADADGEAWAMLHHSLPGECGPSGMGLPGPDNLDGMDPFSSFQQQLLSSPRKDAAFAGLYPHAYHHGQHYAGAHGSHSAAEPCAGTSDAWAPGQQLRRANSLSAAPAGGSGSPRKVLAENSSLPVPMGLPHAGVFGEHRTSGWAPNPRLPHPSHSVPTMRPASDGTTSSILTSPTRGRSQVRLGVMAPKVIKALVSPPARRLRRQCHTHTRALQLPPPRPPLTLPPCATQPLNRTSSSPLKVQKTPTKMQQGAGLSRRMSERSAVLAGVTNLHELRDAVTADAKLPVHAKHVRIHVYG